MSTSAWCPDGTALDLLLWNQNMYIGQSSITAYKTDENAACKKKSEEENICICTPNVQVYVDRMMHMLTRSQEARK